MKNIIIENEIELALPSLNYVQDLHEVIINEKARLSKWLPWAIAYDKLEDSRMYSELTMKNFESKKSFGFTILVSGKAVGVMGTHNVDYTNQRTTIGYWISQDYEGKGIVSKGVNALLQFCFEDLNLNKVEIWCALDNMRSNNIPKNLGFKHEGVLREVEKGISGFIDVNVYGLLKSEWKKFKL